MRRPYNRRGPVRRRRRYNRRSRRPRYSGRGDYGFRGGLVRGIGAVAGGAYNAYRGRDILKGVHKGFRKGAKISKILGTGDYTYGSASNQLINAPDAPPVINPGTPRSGDMAFNRREMLANIVVTGLAGSHSPFEIRTFPLNPGLSETCPWGAQISQAFQQYDFEGMVFEFVSISGEAGHSNSLGKCVLVTDYDVDASPPRTTVEAENEAYATVGKPSQHLKHGVETKNSQNVLGGLKFVRTSANTTKDLTFHDLGNFHFITEGIPLDGTAGQQVEQVIGELWVNYKVHLSKPALRGSLLGNNIKNDIFVGQQETTTVGPLSNTINWLPGSQYSGTFNMPATTVHGAPKKTNTIGGEFFAEGDDQVTFIFPENISYGAYQFVFSVEAAGQFPSPDNITMEHCRFANGGVYDQGPGYSGFNHDGYLATTASQTHYTQHIISTLIVEAPNQKQAKVTMRFDSAPTGLKAQYKLIITQVPADALDI